MTFRTVYIAAFKYPPYSGVGGNRWWHISQCLSRKGIHTKILTVDRGQPADVPRNLEVEYLRSDFFYRLLEFSPKNRYLRYIFLVLKEGLRRLFWFDDEAQYWGKALTSKINNIISHEGRICLIATGHPFQVNRWAAVAKKSHGEKLFLVQDFQDPWADNPFKKYLFRWQREKVRDWQQFSLCYSDLNIFVTKGLRDLMSGGNGVVLENAHSVDANLDQVKMEQRYIVHAGTLANGRDVVAEPFFQLCLNDPCVLRGMSVRFYGRISHWLVRKYSKLFDSGLFQLYSPVPQEELYEIIRGSCFALQFNAEEYPYLVSTKIYEYPALGVPTLSINCGGEIDRLIVEHSLGFSVRPTLSEIRSGISDIFGFDEYFKLELFGEKNSFSERAAKLIELIK